MSERSRSEHARTQRQRQLRQWVAGRSVHDHQHAVCCPDYSCCRPDLAVPREVREHYYRLLQQDDPWPALRLRLAWLGRAVRTEKLTTV